MGMLYPQAGHAQHEEKRAYPHQRKDDQRSVGQRGVIAMIPTLRVWECTWRFVRILARLVPLAGHEGIVAIWGDSCGRLSVPGKWQGAED